MAIEYKTVTLDELISYSKRFKVDDSLNLLGEKGWELVSVDRRVAYFKREVKQDPFTIELMKLFAQAPLEIPYKQVYED